ncbi:hypothetical protein DL738_20485 [Escherichia coli]|nr:hypothetical protein [Salmonella enterica]EGE2355172.1 hypothetical protein [Escherichia coli]EHE3170038.1 hypothetical protein [Salmonella enterica]EHS0389616.1 hypothetical protein [Salmonella enterica]EIV1877255.1 hypothetical protein [Salmonella enterica]
MKSNRHSSGVSGTKRVLKTDIALSLLCWVFTSPFSNWTEKYFTGTEVPESPMTELDQVPEAIFRFVLNDEGFDVGYDAVGMDLCCFSIPLSAMPTVGLDEEETLSRLTGEMIHGVLLSLPEYLEMPDRLVYQLNDEVMAFNSQCGNGIFHGWTSAKELWRNEILPRTTILMQHTSVIH